MRKVLLVIKVVWLITEEEIMRKTASRIVLLVAFIATIFILISANDAVAEEVFDVPGKSYDSDTQYDFITSSPVVSMTFGKESLGTLKISGNVW